MLNGNAPFNVKHFQYKAQKGRLFKQAPFFMIGNTDSLESVLRGLCGFLNLAGTQAA